MVKFDDISLCMIVKNEAQTLPRCLASAQPHVTELIVVDTGSRDETREIAAAHGARVEQFIWCDDFAAARNYALTLVRCNWVLMLDADEELIVHGGDLQSRIQSGAIAYLVAYHEILDTAQYTPSYRACLFQNLPQFRYRGKYHETLQYEGQEIPADKLQYLDGVSIHHYGFRPEVVKAKHRERNIPMLERLRQTEGLSIRLLHCLAVMYAETDQLAAATECSREILDRLTPNLLTGDRPKEFHFIPCALFSLGVLALEKEDYETVTLLCQRGLEWCGNYPPLNYLAGVITKKLGFIRGAVGYFEYCLQMGKDGSYYRGEPFEMPYMTTYAAWELGLTYQDLGDLHRAIAAWQQALEFDPNFTPAQVQLTKTLGTVS